MFYCCINGLDFIRFSFVLCSIECIAFCKKSYSTINEFKSGIFLLNIFGFSFLMDIYSVVFKFLWRSQTFLRVS